MIHVQVVCSRSAARRRRTTEVAICNRMEIDEKAKPAKGRQLVSTDRSTAPLRCHATFHSQDVLRTSRLTDNHTGDILYIGDICTSPSRQQRNCVRLLIDFHDDARTNSMVGDEPS
ncbi:hypothetical protein J6590_019238 [Homalodisca vitripennis]|nr:hypothetical protein J6590_019238 [Homalodisca vitripennis]